MQDRGGREALDSVRAGDYDCHPFGVAATKHSDITDERLSLSALQVIAPVAI